jgi:hypothetical protein
MGEPRESFRVLKQVSVHYAPGRYGGWPGNHGVWSWGSEILVGFHLGYHKGQGGHPIDWQRPILKVQARSLDGGETWTLEDTIPGSLDNPTGVAGGPSTPHSGAIPCPGGIEFVHSDLALTFSHATLDVGPSRFWASYDRGRSWSPAYRLPDMGTLGIAARTDYLVNGSHDCTLFLTAAKSDLHEGRPCCGRTRDGGAHWDLVSWIGPEPAEGFCIMPASVRLPSGSIIVALRQQPNADSSCIPAYRSDDEGRTWTRLPDPVPALAPSNPPALTLLRDGRLCVTYGVRAAPFRMCARLSADEGRSWGEELVLRSDGANWDLGYPRNVQRPDGSIVTIYYFNDAATGPERYIAATIWRPGAN